MRTLCLALQCIETNYRKFTDVGISVREYASAKYDKILDGFSQFPVQLVQWGQVYKRRKFIELSVMTLNRIYKNTDLPIIQHKIVLAYLLSEDKEYKDALELLKGMRSELKTPHHHVNTKSRPYCTSRLYASSFLTYHIPGRICLNCTKT